MGEFWFYFKITQFNCLMSNFLLGSQYEKNLPPSYNEIFANDSSSVPSAPLMDEYAAQNMPPPNANTGWQPPQGMAPGIPPQLQHTQQQMNAPIYQPQNSKVKKMFP